MKTTSTLLLSALLLGNSSANANIDIVFDYTYDSFNYFTDITRRDILNSAASVFEARFEDSLSAITSGGGNQFDAVFANPSNGAETTITNYNVAADQIIVFVGAYDLGGATLGQGGPGGYNASATTQAFLDTVDTRGQTGALNPPYTDFGPWGGSIAFNNTSNFYFDSDPASFEAFTGFDFYSIAVHELGHLLGFGTSNSYSSNLSGGNFAGNAVKTLTGVQPVTADGHWISGLQYDGRETSMDPDIAAGARTRFTELDFAAMKDIGWEVSPVPEAETWGMMLAGLGLLGWRLRVRPASCGGLTRGSQSV